MSEITTDWLENEDSHLQWLFFETLSYSSKPFLSLSDKDIEKLWA